MTDTTTIDTLSIEITSNATGAATGIDALATSLGKLKQNGSVSVAVKNLNNLTASLKQMTSVTSNASKLNSLADAVSKLSSAGSFTKVISQLNKLPTAVKGLDQLDFNGLDAKFERVAAAAGKLSSIKAGGLGNMVNALGKLGQVTASLDDATINAFAKKVALLNEKLGPLSTKMASVSAGFNAINSNARKAAAGTKELGSKVNSTTLNLSSMITVIQGVYSALQPVIRLLVETISVAIEWDGIAQRFGRGFGEQADEVYAWVKKLNEEMGINIQQFMQYSSVYATMLTGFGVASEDSSKMALGYMELTYDIWAGYNDIYKSLDDAAIAIRSAIAGEVEPIRKAGFTIVESQLEQTAATYGLEISLENATEAQKSYLRYLTLIDQAYSQNLVGTYAREMNTAEGLMRTFRQQLKSLAQTFGSLFLPILVKIMPYVQAFVEMLSDAVHGVAEFFGITLQEVDWSGYNGADGLGSISDAADSATGALGDTADTIDKTTEALKDLKHATVGIDELNVISPPTGSGGAGGAGGDSGWGTDGNGVLGDLDVGSLWDDSIFDQIQFQVDDIKAKLTEALSILTAVVSGFALAVGTILVVSGANIPTGLALMAFGAVGLVATITENWNGMSDKLAKTLTVVTATLGGFLLAIGAFLAFSGVNVPLGAGLMVAGAASLATAVAINWKFLNGEMKNSLSILTGIVGGALLAMGALFAFTGVAVGLGIALMVGGAVSLATSVALNWDSLSAPMKKAVGMLEAIVGGAMLAFGAVLALSGANIPLGLGMLAAGFVSVVSAVALNWDSLTGDMKSSLGAITAIVGGALLGIGAILCLTGVAMPLGIAMLAAGSVGVVSAIPINWSSLANSIKTVTKEIGVFLGTAFLALGAILTFTGVAMPLGIALLAVGAASLIGGIALNWDAITNKVKEIFGKVKEWVEKNGRLVLGILLCLTGVGLPIGIGMITKHFSGSGSEPVNGNALVDKVKSAWTSVKNWWDKKPKLSTYTPSIGSIKEKISSAWSSAKSWWDKTKGKLAEYTPSIGSIKSKLSSAWSTAKTWWSKSKGSLSFTPTIGSIKSKLQSAWNTAKSWWSKNVKLSIPSLSFKVTYTNDGLGTVKKAIVKALGLSGWPKLSFAKNGGIFDTGSLIWAGEAGAEVVANAGGGKTGVMNVDQMSEAVYEGVYAAVIAAMRATGGNGGEQAVNVYLDGKQITSAVEKRQHERGASIMGNQVYSY